MNKKATIWVIVLLVVVAGAGAWAYVSTKPSNTNQDNTSDNSTKNSSTDNANNAEVSATITATNDGFTPSTVTVKKGQTIKVVNNSSLSIQFSSDNHPTHLLDPELNMSGLEPGESGVVTPENVGSHGYHDHEHPDHTGTIIVTE